MDPSHSSRRDFARRAAVLAATPFALPEDAAAQAQNDPTAVAGEALYGMVQSRYGKFLTPMQLDAVKRAIARNQATALLLRQVKLDNGDEPAAAFRADLP